MLNDDVTRDEDVTTDEGLQDNSTDNGIEDSDGGSAEESERSDSETSTENPVEKSRETDLQRYERHKNQAERLAKKLGLKSEGSKEAPSLDQELISRTFIATIGGYTDKEVQNEAIRLAKKFGMNVAEALEDPDISTRLKNLQKNREAQKALAKGTGGSATRTKDVDYVVSYYKNHGDFPEGVSNSLIAKAADKIAKL